MITIDMKWGVVMKYVSELTFVCLIIGAAAFATLPGCGTSTGSISAGGEAAADSATTDTLVFGRFRLIRNGEDVRLGEGFFANHATLHLHAPGKTAPVKGKVGRNGEFAWVLDAGKYRVSGIEFMARGDRFTVSTEVAFTASDEHRAAYLGTIALETSLESGYHGMDVRAERYSVSDDCETDCDRMLADLGMPEGSATVALMRAETESPGGR